MVKTVSAEELEEVVRRTNRPFSGGIGFMLEKKGPGIFSRFPEKGTDEKGSPVLSYHVGPPQFDEETGLLFQAKVVVSIVEQEA